MSLESTKPGLALVTGASRGIGRAIAHQFAGAGHDVIGTATTSQGATRISATASEAGLSITGLALNVADPASIDALGDTLKASGFVPTILVHNAGVTRDQLAMRMSDEDWDTVLETNLSGVFRLTRMLLRGMMKARNGRIVCVTSVVGATGNPGQINYAAAKAGLVGFAKSLAREVASRGITVNCVAPGFIETDMTAALPEKQREALLTSIPVGRFGGVEEIAAAVSFLAGPGGGYITGETLHVNGGMHMAS